MSSALQPAGDSVEVIRAALAAGPTPGPWTVCVGDDYRIEAPSLPRKWPHAPVFAADSLGPYVATIGNHQPDFGRIDADLIAACSPDALAVVLARLDAAERENAFGCRWIMVGDRLPAWSARDDTPCFINGKEVPPTLTSETVLVALKGGGVRTDKLTTIEGKSDGWWHTYGERVIAWRPTPEAPGAAL